MYSVVPRSYVPASYRLRGLMSRHLWYRIHARVPSVLLRPYRISLVLVPTVPASTWTHITLVGPTVYIAPTGRIFPTANLSRLPSLATASYGSTRPGSAEDKIRPSAVIFLCPSLRFRAQNTRNRNKPFIGHLASCADSIVLIYDFKHLIFEIVGNSS